MELRISIKVLGENMKELTEWDNGVGSAQEIIPQILRGEYRTKKSGFGIYSVKQRVELFYGTENALDIISEYGNYTEIREKIPRMEEE